ncbi:uncharacterized protein DUF3857 [Mucilaginibacter frigoritolerans]|uniref:Uncharacterized protein DUF3857 n=1 Tax=Mucilaginibacter frigoritolerans TaxID=652788 RepID=A0A562TX05_9SPHI|nr:DUF3857 domain-containing protein [Mucilaginibacter frigoritolerans]TWI97644.1 uncharacterized protein DUF3857 [Mucilaginibacter frigoritolerans]
MKKVLIIILVLSFFSKFSQAQDFTYGTITQEEMDMAKYPKDTSAHGVVLKEFGDSKITYTKRGIRLIHTYHVKIKIFDNKGFSNATIEIPVYGNNNEEDDINYHQPVYDIKGVTSYKDEKGLTQQIDLEDKKIYQVKDNKNWLTYKFAMPGVRNGCVIEYQFTFETSLLEHFFSWEFQGAIPKISSEYDVHIPAFWDYNASLRGTLKLNTSQAKIESPCFSLPGAHCDCSFIVYSMNDVPAFVEEEAMTASKNYKSAIYFTLIDYTNPYTGKKGNGTKEWADIDDRLKSELFFNGQLKRKGLLKDKIRQVIENKTDTLNKAKAIYSFLQKWFKWDGVYGIYSENLSKALDKHSGSDADINLSLVTALNAAGLNANAVILSTRENGTINNIHPSLDDFNYVVAKLFIGNQSYLLDATDPLLPFGVLPLRCLNGKGRVMSLDKPSYWIDMDTHQSKRSASIMDFTLQENGKLKGTITNYSIGYDAYLKRNAIKKFNSTDEYVDDRYSNWQRLKVLKSTINNLDSLDKPLEEIYEVEISQYDQLNNSKFAFTPFVLNKITENPFKLAERSYPVDWGMPSEDKYIVNVHLPGGYLVNSPPQKINLGLPNNGGTFLSSYEQLDNTFIFSTITKFNKGIYSSAEYPYLKELYNKIIQMEKSEIVFSKK